METIILLFILHSPVCFMIDEKLSFNGLKDRIFLCSDGSHLKTSTRPYQKYPLFYLTRYNPLKDESQETWRDIEEDGKLSQEDLYWRK